MALTEEQKRQRNAENIRRQMEGTRPGVGRAKPASASPVVNGTVKTSLVKLAPELRAVQSLMPMDSDQKAALLESVKADGIRDPLRGYEQDGTFWILSGVHRLWAAKEAGLPVVPAELVATDDREAYAISENLTRRHMNREQKQGLIDYFLRKHPDESDRAIATRVGVDNKTVGARRAELGSTEEFPQSAKRIGKDGKARRQPAKKATPKTGKKPAAARVRDRHAVGSIEHDVQTD